VTSGPGTKPGSRGRDGGRGRGSSGAWRAGEASHLAKPADLAEPAEPAEPAGPGKPAEPAELAELAGPAEPAGPGKLIGLAEPAGLAESVESAEPIGLVEPVELAESSGLAEPVGFAKSAEPAKPIKPVESIEPARPVGPSGSRFCEGSAVMGWNNPPVRWSELERILSGRPEPHGDGGDSPAWTHKRERYTAPAGVGPPSVTDLAGSEVRVPYAELHCHSNFSFLDGASHPEELVESAALLGLDAIAITDHDGMYGVVRFAEAAKELGVRTVFGTELSLGLTQPQNGIADPEGDHLLLLATGVTGYGRLCRAITDGQLAHDSEKGRPIYDFDDVVDQARGEVVVLTGCRKASVRRALLTDGPDAAFAELYRLADAFGRDHTYVELIDHGLPLDTRHNDLLAEMALELRLPIVATNAVHYAQPHRGELAAAMAAVRARRSLDDLDGWLPPAPTAYLRSGE
jgi:hypothetical protein